MSQPVGPTQPTIGRIVHYVDNEGYNVPAIVTAVAPHEIALTVFTPDAPPDHAVRARHYEPQPGQVAPAGTWHWPLIR